MRTLNAAQKAGERFYAKALVALDDENWLKALQYLRRASEDDPKEGKYLRVMAEIYLQHQHLDEATDALQKSLILDEGDLETLFLMGNTYLMKSQYRKALKIYLYIDKELEEPSPELSFHIALSYYHGKAFKKSLRYLEDTLDEDPSFIEAYELMGNVYLENDDLEKAKWALQELLELEPGHLQARQMMGKIFTKEVKRQKPLTVVSKCPESR